MSGRGELGLIPRNVRWTPQLSVGVEEIDAQHRELFRRVDLFLAAMAERRGARELEPLLRYLRTYAQEHFAQEQQLMEFSGYAALGDHLEEHQAFESRCEELADELAGTGPTLGLARELVGLLVEWLSAHVSTTDRRFGAYLAAFRARRGQKPSA
jgi:hemerythrin